MSNQQISRRMLRLPEVILITGIKRACIYKLMKKDEFPKQKRLTAGAVGWESTEIENWLETRANK